MLIQLIQKYKSISADIAASKLYDETSFYKAFIKDLSKCHKEVIIESPYITSRRLNDILPLLKKLKSQSVKIAIITKDPREHDKEYYRDDVKLPFSATSCLFYLSAELA